MSTLPPVINYLPLRTPILLNWKRSFSLRFPPQSLGDAVADFRNTRSKSALYHGNFSGTFSLVETILIWAAQAGVQVADPRVREVSRLTIRAAVMTALQPCAQAGTWAIMSDENIGMARALSQMTAEGVPLFNGAAARVAAAITTGLVREHVTAPAARAMREYAIPHPLTAEQKKVFDRPTMMRRVKEAVADIYASSLALFSASAITYPLECVRMRVESQYAVFHTMKYSGTLDCIRTVYATEGVAGFYRGFYSWALIGPVELLWPLFAWATASLLVYSVFEDEADDEETFLLEQK